MSSEKFISEVREVYEHSDTVHHYDRKRFASAGGRLVDKLEKAQVLQGLAQFGKGASVLDVAAGTGRFSLMLARKGYQVTAFDNSPHMLSTIKSKAEKEGLRVTLQQGDALKLPFEDNAFDAVVSIRLLWHFDDITATQCLKELYRVVKPSGTVFVDFFNVKSLRFLVTWAVNMRKGYTFLTTPDKIHKIISKSGGTIAATRYEFIFPYFMFVYCPKWALPVLWRLNDFFLRKKTHKLATVFYVKIRKPSAKSARRKT